MVDSKARGARNWFASACLYSHIEADKSSDVFDDMDKICAKCFDKKPLILFGYMAHTSDKKAIYCKPCVKAYARAYRDNNLELLLNYLKEHPCVDCGESDIRTLDFDHREPADKKHDINRLKKSGSPKALFAEIAKCDVRCANCHRKRTVAQVPGYRTPGWTKPLISSTGM